MQKFSKKINFSLKGVHAISKEERYKALNQMIENGQMNKKITSNGTHRYRSVK